jgi:hypothetical protein
VDERDTRRIGEMDVVPINKAWKNISERRQFYEPSISPSKKKKVNVMRIVITPIIEALTVRQSV